MNKIITKLQNYILSILLFVSFLVIILIVIWNYSPYIVDEIDKAVKSHYLTKYELRLNKYVGLIDGEREHDTVNSGLIKLLKDLDSVKSQDRLGEIKNKAFDKLIQRLKDQKQYLDAISWSEKWLRFNNRNLDAWLNIAILYEHSGRYDDASRILTDWHNKTPELEKVTKLYSNFLINNGHDLKGITVISNFLENRSLIHSKQWDIFWSYDDKFNSKLKKNADEIQFIDGKIEITTSLPPKEHIKEVRFDPPDYNISWCMLDPVITLYSDHIIKSYLLSDYEPKWLSSSMEWNGTSFKVSYKDDPHFAWVIPAEFKGKVKKVKLSANIHYCFPGWVINSFSNDKLSQLKSKNILLKNEKILNFISKVEEYKYNIKFDEIKTLGASMDVFWRVGNQKYNSARRNRVPIKWTNRKLMFFTINLPVLSGVDALRIDFPEIQDIKYEIKKFEIFTDGGKLAVDLNKASLIGSELNDKIYHVTGTDPQIMYSIPEKYKNVSNIVLEVKVIK
jgi:hypothetical protein